MDPLVAERLRQFNRAFYEAHAKTFAATRQAPWPGWFSVPSSSERLAAADLGGASSDRVLADASANALPNPKDGAPRFGSIRTVLDLGCGNGRYLAFLRSQGFTGPYLGIDSSPSLIEIARATYGESADVSWRCADLDDALGETSDHGPDPKIRDIEPEHARHERGSGEGVRENDYELVIAWGVLHHVPGFDNRIRLLRRMLDVAHPDGAVCVSLWQFRHHERFASHECEPESFGLSRAQLEDGDALLDWQGEGSVPRYCHHFSDAEIDRICAAFPGIEIRVDRPKETSDRFNAYVTFRVESGGA